MSELDPSQELAELLQAASRGEASAWRELVNRYSRRVFALAKSRCRNDDVAEEIAQSVFATVAVKISAGEYTESGRFESWLFRVAMNRVRDTVRKAKRRPESQDPEVFSQQPGQDVPEPAFEPGTVGRLRRAMATLSESDREIIELRHHGGLSFKQMSQVLDEPVGTLLARHHRALKKLKDILESTGSEQDSQMKSGKAAGREVHDE